MNFVEKISSNSMNCLIRRLQRCIDEIRSIESRSFNNQYAN